MLHNDEVARIFQGVFGFWLFLLLRFVLEKYVWYKICSLDLALSNKKKFDGFRCRQYGIAKLDIIPKTFATYIS